MPTKSAVTIVASQSNAAAGTTRGVIDLRTGADFGGIVSITITNGTTAPTVPCTCNILAAYNDGTTPVQESAGTDWKTLHTFVGSDIANDSVELPFSVDPAIQHLEVEFTGNTGQPVTVEAVMSRLSA